MSVTDKDLCQKLHELTKWDPTPAGGKARWVALPDDSWDCLRLSDVEANGLDKQLWFWGIPAYELGDLLRKLPLEIETEGSTYFFQLSPGVEDKWQLDYRDENDGQFTAVVGDTPENTVCKMAIELADRGLIY